MVQFGPNIFNILEAILCILISGCIPVNIFLAICPSSSLSLHITGRDSQLPPSCIQDISLVQCFILIPTFRAYPLFSISSLSLHSGHITCSVFHPYPCIQGISLVQCFILIPAFRAYPLFSVSPVSLTTSRCPYEDECLLGY
jgi:hypothetical protein